MYAAVASSSFAARTERLNVVHFPQNVACVLEERRAALRRADAAAGALKDAEAQRLLQIVQDAAQVRLPEEEILRRLRDRARAFDLDDVL